MGKAGKGKAKKKDETTDDDAEAMAAKEEELKLQMMMKNIGKGGEDQTENVEQVDENLELTKGKKGKKDKKGGKKKVKKEKEKSKYDLMREEIARQEELKRQEKEEARLREEMVEQEKMRVLEENDIRNNTLALTCEMLNKVYVDRREREASLREYDQWLNYLKCDGTPDLMDMQSMNFYIYRWQIEPTPRTLMEAGPRFQQVNMLINMISDYLTNPINTPLYRLKLFRHLRYRLYKELANKLDGITYHIIRDVRNNFQSVDTFSGQVSYETDTLMVAFHSKYNINHCIDETDENIQLPIILDFPSMGVSIYVPYQLMYKMYVVRVVWSKYDDFSVMSSTHEPVMMPDLYRRDLYQYNLQLFLEKQQLQNEYQEELHNRKRKIKKSTKAKHKEMFEQEGSEEGEEEEEKVQDVLSSILSFTSVHSQRISDWDLQLMQPVEVVEEVEEEILPEKPKKGKEKKQKKQKKQKKGKKKDDSSAKEELAKQELLKKQAEELSKLPPIPLPSEIMFEREEENKKSLIAYLTQTVKPQKAILNLRKFRVVGGIYHIEYLEAVPQIKTLTDLSRVHVTHGEQAIKRIVINMNTSHVIKQVFNKYRDKLGEIRKTKDNKKNEEKKFAEDKKRIATSLNKLSMEVERRLTSPDIKPKKNAPVEEVAFVIAEDTIELSSNKRGSRSTRERRDSSSSIASKVSIISTDAEASEHGEEFDEAPTSDLYAMTLEDNIEVTSMAESEDSFKSRDSMFEEFIVENYDSINFKPKVKIRFPSHVLFFDKPFPVIWHSVKKSWYYNDERLVNNIEYEESQEGIVQSVSFRYTKPESPVALAVRRFIPLPFTHWELFPNVSKTTVESITFRISTELVSAEFELKNVLICLKSIEIRLPNQNQNIIDDEIGKFVKPIYLIRKMRRLGIDMFPDHDSYIYMEDMVPKNYICENHTYRCMALACTTYAFKSSKWNKTTNNILMNIREEIFCSKNYNYDYSLCLINYERAVIMNCAEGDETLVEEIPEQNFCPDLYWILQDKSCTYTKDRIQNVDTQLADTVYLMLCKTLIISYS